MGNPSRALMIRVSAIATALFAVSMAVWGLTIYFVAEHLAPACDEAMDIQKFVVSNTANVAAIWVIPILVAAAATRVPGAGIIAIAILVLAESLALLFPFDEFNFTLSPLDIDCDKRHYFPLLFCPRLRLSLLLHRLPFRFYCIVSGRACSRAEKWDERTHGSRVQPSDEKQPNPFPLAPTRFT
jgi:hypothetical protein